jgi:hypothetical protein
LSERSAASNVFARPGEGLRTTELALAKAHRRSDQRSGVTHLVAIVTDSSFLRAALTAMHWIAPHRYTAKFFEHAPAAIVWLEDERSETLPELTQMLVEARRRTKSKG